MSKNTWEHVGNVYRRNSNQGPGFGDFFAWGIGALILLGIIAQCSGG